jgi:hypothetical protein
MILSGQDNLPSKEQTQGEASICITLNGVRWFLASDYALYAELFRRKGKPSQAKEKLGKATNLFRECRADGWLKKAEKELAALSR